MDYQLSIEEWLPRFPLTPEHNRYQGDIITSPGHLCNNHQLRKELSDQIEWGRSVPVDIFVMADGEASVPYATKIGGLPYRISGRSWPRTKAGAPMQFFGQFCFVYSKDITGPLPADVLLVFGILEECEYATEWYPLEIKECLQASEVPAPQCLLHSCHGYRLRTLSFPDAEWNQIRDVDNDVTCRGLSLWSPYFLPQYQATQIGEAPFFISEKPELPGRILCTISSVQPEAHGAYPWVNRREPLLPPGEWKQGPETEKIMIGDMGCLYVSIDDKGRTHVAQDCY